MEDIVMQSQLTGETGKGYLERDKGVKIEEANRNYKTHVVVECIIPAGSIYYVGIFGAYDKKSYASNKLKYVKIVENENNK
jgi:hypothetical protein